MITRTAAYDSFPVSRAPARDRRRHQRVKVSVMGRYMLANRQEFPCQTIDMSVGGVSVAAPVRGAIGERVIIYLDGLGRVEGLIARHIEDGFTLALSMSVNKRDKLADQLTWLANRARLGLPEDRRHERIEPRKRASTMKLPDGREYQVRLIDISLSGVALQTDFKPPLNELVMVGNTRGRVIRHFDNGVAIEFARLLSPSNFDESIEI